MRRVWFLFSLCALVASFTGAQEQKKEVYSFRQFSDDFKLYHAEPGWIIKAFLLLPLDQFDAAWELFIPSLQDCSGVELLVQQCRQYDEFLKHLLIDTKHKKLMLVAPSEQAIYLKQPHMLTVFNYWRVKKNTLYQQLYAFYFDVVAKQLVETIRQAYCEHNTSEYPTLYKKAVQYRNQLLRLYRKLMGTTYDERYAFHLNRYREVLDELDKERAAYVGDGGV